MDDTQQSRASDAAATRKRRSSILKSQRAPRAPFSELEFNVATPTDTAKSRRVSFSRRTGVAEFITNEATTTWRNFYEEHNKSLESSGNESAANAPRSSVGHLGKRNFEDQFQEVEAIDFGSTVSDSRGVETSINNIKFDQFALECTADDRKLTAPRQNFEFSTFTVTEQSSKLFGDDLAISGLGEISDKIDVNFSTVQRVGDDLDEIQKDLERHQANSQNFVYPGPRNRRNMSEYIEVDLNMTHDAAECEAESLSEDMSITDTIHSPKVNVSKNGISGQTDKSLNDWVADKENIAVNPYVTPKESVNFAINEMPDKILVFDGKRLTLQSEKDPITDYRKTLLPTEQPDKPSQRKTIVLNVHDDLPNFIEDPHTLMSQHSKNITMNETLLRSNCDISITQPVLGRIEVNSDKRQTMVFDDTSGDISMTQALPTNIAPEKHEKRRTIVFDNDAADISVTQAVPANVIVAHPNMSMNEILGAKQKTIAFESETSNISITQALSTNMIFGKSDKSTFIYERVSGDISVTHTLPAITPITETEKRKTLVFNDESGNISITKPIPTNIKLSGNNELEQTDIILNPSLKSKPEKRNTIVFNNEDGNISVTKAIPSNILLSKEAKQFQNTTLEISNSILSTLSLKSGLEKNKSIVFHDEDGNVSMTKVIPSNILVSDKTKEKERTSKKEPDATISTFPSKSPEINKSIIFHNEDGNISVTKVVPSKVLFLEGTERAEKTMSEKKYASLSMSTSKLTSDKCKSMIFYEDDGNVSLTEAIPSNLISADKASLKTENNTNMVVDTIDVNVSSTRALPSNILLEKENFGLLNEMQYSGNQSQRISFRPKIAIAFEDDDVSTSMPANIITSEGRKTLHDDDDSSNISVTQAVPANLILLKGSATDCNTESKNISSTEVISETYIMPQKAVEKESIVHGGFQQTQQSPLKLITTESTLDLQKNVVNDSEAKDIYVTPIEDEIKPLADVAAVVPENNILSAEVPGLLKQDKSNTLSPTDIMREIIAKLDSEVLITATDKADKSKKQWTDVYNLEHALNETQLKQLVDSKQNEFKKESRQSLLEHTSKDSVYLQRDIVCNPNTSRKQSKDGMHFQNVMVYQTTNNTFIRNEELELESVLSTISSSDGKEELEMKPKTDSENVGNIITDEFVAVASIPPSVESVQDGLATEHRKFSDITLSEVIVPLYSGSISTQDFNIDAATDPKNVRSDSEMLHSNFHNQSCPDKDFDLVESDINVSTVKKSVEKTFLTDLLNMTRSSGSRIVDKNITVNISDTNTQYNTESKTNSTTNSISDHNLFYITKDCDREVQTVNIDDSRKISSQILANHNLKGVSFQPKLKTYSSQEIKPDLEEHVENLENQKEHEDKNNDNINSSSNISDLKRKSYITANSTKELLEMLCEFTEKEEEENPIKPMTGEVALKTKIEHIPERLARLPRRHSVVLSREDLLNNISMAQAMLQSSVATEIADSELDLDTSADSPSPQKHSRVSCEVVKTLHFEDDESSSDPKDNVTSTLTTPLKKIEFTNTSYYPEKNKNNIVIPTHLKNASNHIESLMSDLVNPEVDRDCNQKISTTSNSDSITSSQVELVSYTDSFNAQNNVKNSYVQNATELSSDTNTSSSDTNKSTVSSENMTENCNKHNSMHQTLSGVVEFDPANPLNNVLLAPINIKVTYLQPQNTSVIHTKQDCVSFKDVESSDITHAGHKVHDMSTDLLDRSLNNLSLKNIPENESSPGQISKPSTIDQSVETTNITKNNAIINTVISMQDNKQILQHSSPLIVIGSTLAEDPGLLDSGTSKNVSRESLQNISSTSSESYFEVVSRPQSRQPSTLKSNVNFIEEDQNVTMKKKYDKRKHKTCTLSSLDVTPKPASKVPKRSLSPIVTKNDDGDTSKHRTNSNTKTSNEEISSKLQMSPTTKRERSPRTCVVVQQLMVEYDKDKDPTEEIGDDRLGDIEMEEAESRTEPRAALTGEAAAVRSLPCVRNGECVWECCKSDEWSFLLMHGLVRLTARRGRAGGASGARGAALDVQPARAATIEYEKNAAPALAQRFALESMRRECAEEAGGVAGVGGVAGALRRCAGVARVAAQWARAMHHAWPRLAYTLRADGRLALNVANIPLRTVWEVTMSVELATADGETAWPRARDVCVRARSGGGAGWGAAGGAERGAARVAAAVRADWGHVPTTIWRVFRYLKNLQPEESLLGGLTTGASKH